MPLQNRVDPQGTIVATEARGTMMGNRGGRFHDPATKTLLNRQWASKAWICCVTDFRDRHRKDIMGHSYTELFFLDEVTAMASGHRPCFECRNKDAKAFKRLWQETKKLEVTAMAAEMDTVLHQERLMGRDKRFHMHSGADLPAGTVCEVEDEIVALAGDQLLTWHFEGYQPSRLKRLPDQVSVITPPSIVEILRAGFQPQWHPSAHRFL